MPTYLVLGITFAFAAAIRARPTSSISYLTNSGARLAAYNSGFLRSLAERCADHRVDLLILSHIPSS